MNNQEINLRSNAALGWLVASAYAHDGDKNGLAWVFLLVVSLIVLWPLLPNPWRKL